jgi:hypothetical protein
MREIELSRAAWRNWIAEKLRHRRLAFLSRRYNGVYGRQSFGDHCRARQSLVGLSRRLDQFGPYTPIMGPIGRKLLFRPSTGE